MIEGEIFKRESVRSSFRKKLDKDFDARSDKYSTIATDNLVETLIDSNLNKSDLNLDRLHGWHNCLFEHTQYNKLNKIDIAKFRSHSDMEVVSGAIGHEKVHYKAIPVEKIEEDTEKFLKYCNENSENIYIKSAITHIWFVIIHPYDDGNGRIARAITDYVLAQSNLANANFYSISTTIYKNRKEYYEILDIVCKQTNQDITLWIEWFVKLLENSLDETLSKVEMIQIKTKFWDKHINTRLNDRQKKVILKMLSFLPKKFEGGMRVNKYMSLTKSKRLTASRDISDLVEKGIFESFGQGRGVYYEIKF